MNEPKQTAGHREPWQWHEDTFHGGLSGLFDADNEPIIAPEHENDGDYGAAWFDDEVLTPELQKLFANAPATAEQRDALLVACKAHYKLLRALVERLGLAAVIDATSGIGLTHLAYVGLMQATKEAIALTEATDESA